MSAFSGKQFKGAMRFRREERKAEAEKRNDATPWERTKAYRRQVDKALRGKA